MAAPKVIVVGAGTSGLCAAVNLQTKAGVSDFVVLEKSDNVSGTWWDNQYPGCGCDIPSHLYSFSFELNPNWSQFFSLQPEILKYFEDVAVKYKLKDKIRFNAEVKKAEWLAAESMWEVTYENTKTKEQKSIKANYIIGGVGGLHVPNYPKIDGLESFKGKTIHSARWDHSVEIKGKNVTVVGTAASAIQLIPAIQPIVKNLNVLQRSPNFILPRGQFAYGSLVKWMLKYIPGMIQLYRFFIYITCEFRYFAFKKGTALNGLATWLASLWIAFSVKDKALRAKMTPNYTLGCKRVVISDEYYSTFAKPNVTLQTDAIDKVTATGVVVNGVETPADVIIFATGFQAGAMSLTVIGENGETLQDFYKQHGGPVAYLGITTPKFPNFFLCLGPSTGTGHQSAILHIEDQVNYACQVIKGAYTHKISVVKPKMEIFDKYNDNLQKALSESVWSANCTSWYKSPSGKIFAAWPDTTISYRWHTLNPRWSDFETDNKSAQSKIPGGFKESFAGSIVQALLVGSGLALTFN